VGSPSMDFHAAITKTGDTLEKVFPKLQDIKALSEKCKNMNSFKANVLRTTSWGSIEWEKKGEEWEGGVILPVEQTCTEKEKSEGYSPWT